MQVCVQEYVSEVALDAALIDARSAPKQMTGIHRSRKL